MLHNILILTLFYVNLIAADTPAMKQMKTLVMGASLRPNRYSFYAIERLVANKQPVVAFGLSAGQVAGVNIDDELIDYPAVHTITLYMNPQRQQQYYEYLIGLNPERVIFNPGTENPAFESLLRANGISAERACTLVLLSTNQY